MSLDKRNNQIRSNTWANFNRKDFQAYQGQTIFNLEDFLLTKESVVYVNGSPADPGLYTGLGTRLLQFNEGMNEYDQILIIG